MADEGKTDQDPWQVANEELEQSFEHPAIVANRFFVTVGPAGARITFAEQYSRDSQPRMRTSVLVNHYDAVQLWQLLRDMIAPYEDHVQLIEKHLKEREKR